MDQEFIEIFLEEAEEELSSWEQHCLDLERNGFSDDTINALFRCVHNLKGSSRTVGLEAVGGYVHQVEDKISLIRTKEYDLTPGILGGFLECQKILVEWLEALADDPDHVPQSELDRSLEELAAQFGTPSGGGAAPEASAEAPEQAEPAAPAEDPAAPAEESAAPAEEPITQAEVEAAAQPEASEPAEPEKPQNLGEILVEQGSATREDIVDAVTSSSVVWARY